MVFDFPFFVEMEKELSDCKQLREQTSKMKDLPYVPKCTDDGLFERVQVCDDGQSYILTKSLLAKSVNCN